MNNISNILGNYNKKALGVYRHYAVLLPLIDFDGEDHILYEVRSEIVPQPGDTSFPGGRVEKGESPQAAALRETLEELQIRAEQVEILGEIDYIISGATMIHCFIGRLQGISLADIQPNEEVARVFTIPLSYLAQNQPEIYTMALAQASDSDFPYHLIRNGRNYPFRGINHEIPFYHLPEEKLWGFTANLTNLFINILKDANYPFKD